MQNWQEEQQQDWMVPCSESDKQIPSQMFLSLDFGGGGGMKSNKKILQ